MVTRHRCWASAHTARNASASSGSIPGIRLPPRRGPDHGASTHPKSIVPLMFGHPIRLAATACMVLAAAAPALAAGDAVVVPVLSTPTSAPAYVGAPAVAQ